MSAQHLSAATDPGGLVESHQLANAVITDAERDRARLKVASVAADAADCAHLLDALGLNWPVEIHNQLAARRRTH